MKWGRRGWPAKLSRSLFHPRSPEPSVQSICLPSGIVAGHPQPSNGMCGHTDGSEIRHHPSVLPRPRRSWMTFEAHLKRTTRAQTRDSSGGERLAAAAAETGLTAAILAVQKDEAVVLVVRSQVETGQVTEALPFGPFAPREHRALESGLRKW